MCIRDSLERSGVGERGAFEELLVVPRQHRILARPVDIAGFAEAEPADAASQSDVGERIALAVAPGPAFQLRREAGQGAADARDLLFDLEPVAHQDAGIE